jgi:hypothetical protein
VMLCSHCAHAAAAAAADVCTPFDVGSFGHASVDSF